MTIAELNEQFRLPGVLEFEEHETLARARVTSASASAAVYLQGAHLADWQPVGQEPLLYLSPKSELAVGKAIRGGIPVCFPWFGPRSDGGTGPSHGFARVQQWQMAFAALVPSVAGDEVHLTFTLEPTDMSRSLGFDGFRVAYQMVIGKSLMLRLAVANLGDTPLRFEEALHSYFAVTDVRQARISGLGGAEYLDKRDGGARKRLGDGEFQFAEATDRVFPGSHGPCVVRDRQRTITVAKTGSATTVIWNPWADAGLKDLPEDDWERFCCVETANTGEDGVTLQPGEAHTMEASITVAAW